MHMVAPAKVANKAPPKKIYNPSHPDAKEDGYVEMPNISVLEETVDMMSATRAYQANAAVLIFAERETPDCLSKSKPPLSANGNPDCETANSKLLATTAGGCE